MKKLLLTTLNSKYVHSNLALKYLYTAAAEAGILDAMDVNLLEFTINNPADYVFSEIVRGGYDAVAFSCYIWNIEQTKALCENLKKAQPELILILGGPEVSFDTEGFMEENPWVDYILCGEGEDTFVQLCCNLSENVKEPWQIPALCYFQQGKAVKKQGRSILSMDQVPFPYKLLPVETDKVCYYEASRGCPYSCSYCLSSLEKGIRPKNLEKTLADLTFFLSKEVKQVKFIDRTFNFDKKRALEIWQFLIENDNGITNFHFEICASLLDESCFALLSKARKGLFQMEIGIQSTNEKALRSVDRREDSVNLMEKVRSLVKLGNMHIHVDLIAGLPYEDYNSFKRSFNDVYNLGADNLQLGFLKLLKGTKIREQTAEHGYVFRSRAPYEVISNKYISATELVRLKMVENVLDLYRNKGGFSKTLPYLIEQVGNNNPFFFYEQLAEFYYERGFQHRSHKKEDLYRILFAFAREKGCDQAGKPLLEEDLSDTMNFDAVKKFYKKGWEI